MVEKSVALVSGIQGSLQEKTMVFGQISSAASSGLFPKGYETAMQILAACWFADGLGVHPTVYMEGMQPVTFDGKTVREPKWEFVNALLRSRLPGFDLEVIEDSEKACELVLHAEGRRPQKVRYTWEDATKQGLTSKQTYQKNPRQMLWKQCFKMAADRIGSDVLAGLPSMVYEVDESEAAPAANPTAALDAAIANVQSGRKDATDVAFTESKPESVINWKKRLTESLTAMYGKQKPEVIAEKISLLYNEATLAKTGADPQRVFRKGAEVGPADAQLIVEYLEARKGAASVSLESDGPSGAHDQPGIEASEPSPSEDDAPPPLEEEPAAELEHPTAKNRAYDALMGTVMRARKVFADEPKRRLFVQDSPPQSGKFYFTDLRTVKAAGLQESVKLQVAGEVVATVEVMDLLNKILTEACDAKERGGR